jgi:hypothetical protein
MARIPVTVQGSSPGASGELTMPFILPGALTEHRNSRRSMTDCLEGRYAQQVSLPVRRSAGVPGCPGMTVSSRR